MTRKMKDSGIEWIGEIPEEWKIRKLNDVAETVTDYVASGSFASLNENVKYLDEPDYAMLIRTADLSETKMKHIYINKHAYEFLSNSNLFGGEIILSNIGSVGNVYLYEPMYERSSLAPNSIMLRMKGDNRYYYYWFLNPLVNDELKRIGGNAVQLKFNKTQLRQFKVLEPNIEQQKIIADYLDNKCSRIDQTIEKEKEVIEKLKEYKQSVITEAVTKGLNPNVKMKDSGVEWIGEIPEKWKIVKLKQVFSFRKGLSITKDNLVEKGVKVISYGQIHSKNNNGVSIDDSLIRYVGNEYLEIGKQSLVSQNDFIFADTSEDLNGAGNCVFVDLDEEIFAGYHTIILAPIKRDIISNWRYFAYLYKTDCWRSQIRSRVSGIKLFSITQKILKQVDVIMPDIKEQQEIIDYLDKKCSAIDKLITNKEKVIEKLTEYKKSLIYECVTGKREVQ